MKAYRPAEARRRAREAGLAMGCCELCAHLCRVDRRTGPAGLCHAGLEPRAFSAQTEVSDELELIPTYAIALSGCDLRCDFCITGGPSWNPRAGDPVDIGELGRRATAALDGGARTVMILGGEPAVHLPTALEIVSELPEDAKLVWKTNAHGSARARELLDGMFDVWLADYKFGNDDCALRLARVPDYGRVVRENLTWANAHAELIVRHLLMPGHVDCCWRPVAEWLSLNLPRVKVNLRYGFWPAWHSARHPELRRTTTAGETLAARQIAEDCELFLIE